jgi:putative sterol carrier protein
MHKVLEARFLEKPGFYVVGDERQMTTVGELFQEMPSRFSPEKAGNMNATLLFDLTGEKGGQWTVKIADGQITVNEEAGSSIPTATVRMAAEDFQDMHSGKLNPMMAFMSGKVKVEGDLNTVMKFQSVVGF